MIVTSFNLDQFDISLARAKCEGIRLRATADADLFHATSARTGQVAYAVRVTGELAATCSCPAGQKGTPCKHAASALSAVEKRRVKEAARVMAQYSARVRRQRKAVA